MGCPVAWKCLEACLFFELLQQPMFPQLKQRRSWTQVSPNWRHSSQPSELGFTSLIWSTCSQGDASVGSVDESRRAVSLKRPFSSWLFPMIVFTFGEVGGEDRGSSTTANITNFIRFLELCLGWTHYNCQGWWTEISLKIWGYLLSFPTPNTNFQLVMELSIPELPNSQDEEQNGHS